MVKLYVNTHNDNLFCERFKTMEKRPSPSYLIPSPTKLPNRFIGIGSLTTSFRSDSPLTCVYTHRTWFRKMVPPGIYFI